MKVVVRKIRHSDYLGIIDLFNECFDKNIIYHDLNFNDNKIIIVAEVENEIIGCAEIDIITNEIEDKKFSIINNVSIKKQYKKSSIVTLLVEACINLSKENNCYKILMLTNSKNNLDLFKKLGFNSVDDSVLRKDIRN